MNNDFMLPPSCVSCVRGERVTITDFDWGAEVRNKNGEVIVECEDYHDAVAFIRENKLNLWAVRRSNGVRAFTMRLVQGG